MIKPVTVYLVYCDLCGKLFDNEEPPMRMNEAHMYTSIRRAEIGIQVVGWVVLHNLPDKTPRIICKHCNLESQQHGKIH